MCATFGLQAAHLEHVDDAERRSMAIVGDPLCRAEPEIAQIGRERAETGPAGFGGVRA